MSNGIVCVKIAKVCHVLLVQQKSGMVKTLVRSQKFAITTTEGDCKVQTLKSA